MFRSSKTRDNPSRANPLKVNPISANPSSGYLSRYHPAHGFMGQHNLFHGQQIKATENRSSPMEAHQPCLGKALPPGRIFFMLVNHFPRVKHLNRILAMEPMSTLGGSTSSPSKRKASASSEYVKIRDGVVLVAHANAPQNGTMSRGQGGRQKGTLGFLEEETKGFKGGMEWMAQMA
ncbi:hypothetical protein NL676_010438 [Syzygium grande]|nr:hypothetical protein NL676_010438 [Syzygium grande]